MAKRKEISAWRDDVLHFMTTIAANDKKVRLKKGAADVVHDIGYFFDWQLKDFPGSLTAAEQLAITAAVIIHIQERL